MWPLYLFVFEWRPEQCQEEKRHDLAEEKYQAAYEENQENQTKLLDWVATNDRVKEQTKQNLVETMIWSCTTGHITKSLI